MLTDWKKRPIQVTKAAVPTKRLQGFSQLLLKNLGFRGLLLKGEAEIFLRVSVFGFGLRGKFPTRNPGYTSLHWQMFRPFTLRHQIECNRH